MLNSDDKKKVNEMISVEKKILKKINAIILSPNQLLKLNIKTKLDGKVRNGFEILKLLDYDVDRFSNIFGIII